METIRIMRMELLHTDLYTGPATENDFIFLKVALFGSDL